MLLLPQSTHADFVYPMILGDVGMRPNPDKVIMPSATFEANLNFLDGQLVMILSHLLLLSNRNKKDCALSYLCQELEIKNPLRVIDEQVSFFYKFKIKHFLTCLAYGFAADIPWLGRLQESAVHFPGQSFDKNQFEDYLFFNTQFEKPSTSRHGYGQIYQNKKDFFIKLNLQIRFVKR